MSSREFSSRPFEKLKKRLAQSAAAPVPPAVPSRRKKRKDYTDEELFCSEMDGVQEIAEFRSLAFARGRRRNSGPEQQRRATLIRKLAAPWTR